MGDFILDRVDVILVGLLIVLVLGMMLGVYADYQHHLDVVEEFNNGICKECGSTYSFVEAVGHRYSSTYVYKCNGCGNIIESDTIFNQPRGQNTSLSEG